MREVSPKVSLVASHKAPVKLLVKPTMWLFMVFALTGITTGVATAKDYRIEVIILENLRANSAPGAHSLYIPRRGRAIGLNSDTAANAGFTLLGDDMQLAEQADSIRRSAGYRVLRHFAWRQPGLDRKSALAIRVNLGKALDVYIPKETKDYGDFIPAKASATMNNDSRKVRTTTVNGVLKVSLGRFLHLDSRLVFTDIERGVSYRLHHSRKMRSRELHYIDNPRFGMLVKILPVEE